MRSTCNTGSSGEESSSNWRAASRPESVSDQILPRPDLRRQRQHPAQHFAERRAVVTGDPLAQREQFGVQHRLGVDQPQRLARLDLRRIVVAAQNHAGQLARPERHHEAAALAHPMPQGLRQRSK